MTRKYVHTVCRRNAFSFTYALALMLLVERVQALVHPNRYRAPHFKLKYFEFAGKLLGKSLYETALGGSYSQFVMAKFTRSFLAQLIGLRVNHTVSYS